METDPQEGDIRALIKYEAVVKGFAIVRTIVRGGVFLAAIWLIGEAVKPFAGLETNAVVRLWVTFVTELNLLDIALYILVVLAVGYGMWERHLRQRETRRHASRISELESERDPNRGTSGLTPSGQTRKEDRI